VVEELSALNNDDTKTELALCPAGKMAVSGGSEIGGPSSIALQVDDLYMDGDGNPIGWMARATETSPVSGSWVLVVHVLCAQETA
jgi:hypothetical protein